MWFQKFVKIVSKAKFRSKADETMTTMEVLEKLETRASDAENLISILKAQVIELQKAAQFCRDNFEAVYLKKLSEMKLENQKLKKELNEWKNCLNKAEKD